MHACMHVSRSSESCLQGYLAHEKHHIHRTLQKACMHVSRSSESCLQGYLADEKHHIHRTLQKDYASGPTVVMWGGAVSYERGTPVAQNVLRHAFLQCPCP
jgi:hypothetical protein